MTPLIPVLTRDGLRAVFRADHDGLQARISHIAFGDGGYAPTGAETALRNEHIRVPVAGGAWVGDFTIHMTALLDDGPSFWVREVGIVLSDGTLLAVWSHATTPLVYKTAGVPIVTAFDLSLEALPASAVTVAAGDIDLTLFFGAEFARLGAAVLGNAGRILAQGERVAALESLPGALAAHTAMIGRIEAAGRQLDTRADELLSLAAQLGTALLGDAGRLQAQGERVNALEGLPGAVAALTAMIGRIETAGRRLDIRFGEVEKQLPLRGIQSYQARGSYGFIVPAGVWKVYGRLVGGGGGRRARGSARCRRWRRRRRGLARGDARPGHRHHRRRRRRRRRGIGQCRGRRRRERRQRRNFQHRRLHGGDGRRRRRQRLVRRRRRRHRHAAAPSTIPAAWAGTGPARSAAPPMADRAGSACSAAAAAPQ